MNKAPQTLKGFRDFLPKEKRKRDWVMARIIKTFETWGFEPLETPTLEPLELFEGQIGEDEKLFYKFTDNGGRKVAMRYDQTVPVTRVLAQYQNDLPPLFRRYQIQPNFRAEKPQKGRYREFIQCDADIFGTTSSFADAEVIALSLAIYKNLGFTKAKVLVSDRALLKDIPYEAIVALDKLKKIGEDGVVEDMVKKGIDQNKAKEYLDQVKNLKPNQTIQTIFDSLRSYGFDESWYQFEPTIARSFSYSDGPIWEVIIPEYSSGSVLGGERFNNLAKKISGVDIPGTGFAVGFDRTVEAADQLGLIPSQPSTAKVLVTIFDEKSRSKSLETASKLRAEGINSEVYPALDKLDKQLKLADKKKIPFVVIIGEKEIKENKLTLKNMVSGDQQTLTLEETIAKLKNQS